MALAIAATNHPHDTLHHNDPLYPARAPLHELAYASLKTFQTLPVVRIGGVPEHFNCPFQLAEELGLFKKNGVQGKSTHG